MSEQLWNDEHIESAVKWAKYRGISAGTREMLKTMRDDYEARITELETQLRELRQVHAARLVPRDEDEP